GVVRRVGGGVERAEARAAEEGSHQQESADLPGEGAVHPAPRDKAAARHECLTWSRYRKVLCNAEYSEGVAGPLGLPANERAHLSSHPAHPLGPRVVSAARRVSGAARPRAG